MTFVATASGDVWEEWPHHPESASCSCGWINELIA